MGERGLSFFENEMEDQLKRAGILDVESKEGDEIWRMIIGERWLNQKWAERLAGTATTV